MKKLILSMVMAGGMIFGYANANPAAPVVEDAAEVHVTLSCGVSGTVHVASMQMLLDHIAAAEAYWCD